MDFNNSETKTNLMRAFAGESQARNRYTLAASKAKKANLYGVQQVFLFTAGQEKEHAEIFYKFLKDYAGENIEIEGSYPIDYYDDVVKLLRAAEHNEMEEYDDVYKAFGEKAEEEGFTDIADKFKRIAEIEKTHAERFRLLADLIEQNKLFVSDVKTGWVCLNCGAVVEGTEAPEKCPVCDHDQGYFIRIEMAPIAAGK